MALIALLMFTVLIAAILFVTREPGVKRSAAIWLAFAWLWFASSRNPSMWLNPHASGNADASSAYSEGNSFDRNILTGIMLFGVIVLAQRIQRTTAFLTANLPIVMFFLYCGVSVMWSDHPDISIRRWFRCLGDLIMVMVILTDINWAEAFRWVYVRLACLLLPLSILFFRYFPDLGRSYDIHDGHVNVTGVTDDKNTLGMICMLFSLAVGFTMLEILRREGRRNRKLLIGYGLVLAMGIYIIWIAGSATAVACLIEGAGIMLLTRMPKIALRPARVHMIVGAVLAFAAINLFAGSALLELFGRNSTLTGRTDLWSLCLTLVTNPLFGAGYESFWLGTRLARMWEYIPGVNQSHNGYLEIYLNLGWVGIIFLLGILISGYRNIVRGVRRLEPTASLRLAYFAAACVYNCTEAGFKMVHPMWIALLMVSAARPAWNLAKQASGKPVATPVKSVRAPEFAKALVGRQV